MEATATTTPEHTMTTLTISVPATPTTIGQRVRTLGHGAKVQRWMETGTVVRFTQAGNPVVLADACNGEAAREVTDTAECFRLINDDNRWVYTTGTEA